MKHLSVQPQSSFGRGFTLVEALVAISILLVAVTATFAVVQSGLSSTIAVKDRITAFFLAQEALEAVRNAKDTNLLAQYNTGDPNDPYWLEGIISNVYSCGGNPIPVNIDYSSGGNPQFILCGASCEPLRNSNGLLTHGGGVGSRFTRTITVQEICGGASNQKEAKVTVEVEWPGSNSLRVSDNITNWFAL